jgi:hypothetical protein
MFRKVNCCQHFEVSCCYHVRGQTGIRPLYREDEGTKSFETLIIIYPTKCNNILNFWYSIRHYLTN